MGEVVWWVWGAGWGQGQGQGGQDEDCLIRQGGRHILCCLCFFIRFVCTWIGYQNYLSILSLLHNMAHDNQYNVIQLNCTRKYKKKKKKKDRKSTRLNSSHEIPSRMPSSA
eukprot:TRINITY_DN4286_c2_g1_i1.p3 TRINITY_DN4286_c2_g1~~TRINITY_DN4286_c2_g1_i1.p3  ORF type:complete len:111 (-),score=16.67 TRINITY_DN4286_c2_g1_i1:67-399(-)